MVEMLLNSRAIGLVICSEFVRKQRFKFLKIKRPIYMCNVNDFFNKKGSVKYMVDVKIVDSGLYFIFSFHFILPFFSFSFLFFYF